MEKILRRIVFPVDDDDDYDVDQLKGSLLDDGAQSRSRSRVASPLDVIFL